MLNLLSNFEWRKLISQKKIYISMNICMHSTIYGSMFNSIHFASTVLYIYGNIKPKNKLTLARDWVIDIIGITEILVICTIETSMILVLCFSLDKILLSCYL